MSDNRVTGNATAPGTADVALEGGVFGTQNSVNNCFSGNTFGTSSPADIEGTWGCQNTTTPNGGDALFAEILKLVAQSGARHQRPQPAPRAAADDAAAVPGSAEEPAVPLNASEPGG